MSNKSTTSTIKTAGYHRGRFFTESLKTGVCLPVGLVALGLIGGTLHGAQRAYARKPMKQEDIKAVVNKLIFMQDSPKLGQFIESVAEEYGAKQTLSSSASSNQLYDILRSRDIADGIKLMHMVGYMNHFDDNSFNKNNGKRLFRIIADKVNAMPRHEFTHTNMSRRPR